MVNFIRQSGEWYRSVSMCSDSELCELSEINKKQEKR